MGAENLVMLMLLIPEHSSEVPNLFGSRDQFCGKQFFHGPEVGVWGWFKHITFTVHFASNLMLSLIWQKVPVHSRKVGDLWSSWLLLPSSSLTCPPPKLLEVVSVYQSHFWKTIKDSHVPKSSCPFSICTLPWPLSGVWGGWILLFKTLLPLISLIPPTPCFPPTSAVCSPQSPLPAPSLWWGL